MKFFLLLVASTLLSTACKKDKVAAGELAEVYLLKSYQLVSMKCQVDASTAILELTPIITNDDILEYSQGKYELKISSTSYEKLRLLSDKTPFAITVDKKVLYYGMLKPSYSSSSCDQSITMDYVLPENKVGLHLGYPGDTGAGVIDDQRNHPLWISTLNKQRKLKP